MRTFPFFSLMPSWMVSTISSSVVSLSHLGLVKSAASSFLPFSVRPLPSSPWQRVHFALENSSFGSCGEASMGAGGAVGACCRARARANATNGTGVSLWLLSIAGERALDLGAERGARLGRIDDLRRAREREGERDGVAHPGRLDGHLDASTSEAA